MNCTEKLEHTPRLKLPDAPLTESGYVKAWSQPVEMMTYMPNKPDRNPMFLEARVYQGSSGRVYPLPFYDRIAESPVNHSWKAIHLENEYVRLMILPEIGGRIHVGLDKVNGYDFLYRQNVIKPALVGLAGPWISGGVEFNWPQHHRPATFMPVETEIERHADGSITVWCGDHDPLQRMKGMHGVCLHPGRSIVEVKARLYNRTDRTQTFLWWANVATRVHEKYQSFFPPDVRFVADHAKRAITSFPRSDRPYYGVDYPKRLREGVPMEEQPRCFRPDGSYPPDDLSWYANIPVPTSYMIMATREDFFGGYDHRADAGVLHYADHHIAPGKKQWTWGNHEFGYAWDRSLTDDDGPYVELMAGVYTDNQPDFSFLQPGETKSFSQYWYPLRKIGPAKAASLDCAVNIAVHDASATIGLQTTRDLQGVTVSLLMRGVLLNSWMQDVKNGTPLFFISPVPSDVSETGLEVKVTQGSRTLVCYAPGEMLEAPAPDVAVEPLQPEEITSSDLLYLTGLHLAQYRHATRRPEMYWQEAVRRDDGDARSNTALGRWHLDRGELQEAEKHLRKAIARLTMLNPNPKDGEAHYLLGLTLRWKKEDAASYDAFAKSAWNDAWKGPAYYAMAQMETKRGNWEGALRRVEESLACNVENLNAKNFAVILLRRLHRENEALTMLQVARALDPLDHWSRHLEQGEVPSDNRVLLDLVWDYVSCDETETAVQLLRSVNLNADDGSVPIVLYTFAYVLNGLGRSSDSVEVRRAATSASSDYCFPYGLHAMQVLLWATSVDPSDACAAYYLGNFLYDRQRYEEAIATWERSASLDDSFPTVYRNLGIARFNVRRDVEGALQAFDRAFHVDPTDGRILYERDQLWKRVGVALERRLQELLRYPRLTERRDDLSVELATLYNQTGRPEEALSILLERKFQPWEGGEGLTLAQFTRSQILLGKKALASGGHKDAIAHLEQALDPPASLGEARHLLANKSEIEYWLGVAYAAIGDYSRAEFWWRRAARQAGDFQQMSVLTVSDMTYWRGVALQKLGEEDAAKEVFEGTRKHAVELATSEPKIDYFATSLPAMLLFREDLKQRQEIYCEFLQAQVELGLHGYKAARPLLEAVLQRDINHAGAQDLMRQTYGIEHEST